MIQSPPAMHPNLIDAAYFQMKNNGQYYIPQLGSGPLHIDDWKKIELERWIDSRLAEQKSAVANQ